MDLKNENSKTKENLIKSEKSYIAPKIYQNVPKFDINIFQKCLKIKINRNCLPNDHKMLIFFVNQKF